MKITFRLALIAVLTVVGIIPAIVLGWYSYFETKEAILQEADEKLVLMRDAKLSEMTLRLNNIENGLSSIVNASYTHELYAKLADAAPSHTDNNGKLRSGDGELHKLYKEYDHYYANAVKNFNVYDVFIVSKKSKQVLYTYRKESDLGERFDGRMLGTTPLASVCRKVMNGEAFVSSDMTAYAPSNNDPSMFLAFPIKSDGKVTGAFVVQISHNNFNSFLEVKTDGEKNIDVYFIGTDKLLRTDMTEVGTGKIGQVEFALSNPEKARVDMNFLDDSSYGVSGIEETQSLNGHKVLAAYAPIDVFKQKWVLIVEQDIDELMAPIYSIRNRVMILILLFVLFSPMMAMYVSRFVSMRLVESFDEISTGSRQIAIASDEIASATVSVAEGAHEQASSIEETSATLAQSTERNEKNVDHIEEANRLAQTINDLAESGFVKMNKLLEKMESISMSAKGISKISRTIDEIAFQTNILALNASVEAARAGEEGFGFAVVAEEIKNLSHRTAQSAKEITEMIESTQHIVNDGNETALKSHEMLRSIVEIVEKNTRVMDEVSQAVQEQLVGMRHIGIAMEEIDLVTQQNAASSEEVAAASEELSAQAQLMYDTMAKLSEFMGFTLKKDKKGLKIGSLNPLKRSSKGGLAGVARLKGKKQTLSSADRSNEEIDPETIFPLNADDLKEF